MRQANVQAKATEFIHAIDDEQKEENRKNSKLDVDLLASRTKDLVTAVTAGRDALAKPEEKLELEAHLVAVQHGLDRVSAAVAKVPTAVPGQRRYSNTTREASDKTLKISTEVRQTYGKRLGNSKLAKGVKADLGVGTVFNVDSPPDVRTVAFKQLATLEKPENQDLFRRRGLRPQVAVKALRAAVNTLVKEIGDGTGNSPKQGAVSAEVQASMAWLEIALERTVTTLKDFEADAAAEAIEAAIPVKAGSGRRATDREEEQKEGEQKAGETSHNDGEPRPKDDEEGK